MGIVTVVCDNCGESTEKRSERVGNNTFCDEECWREWQSNSHVEKPCAWCGNTVSRIPSRAEGSKKFFCDDTCQGKWKSDNLTGSNAAAWNSVEVDCYTCNASIYRAPSTLEDVDHVFCGKPCEHEWKSEEVSGDKNPSWNGGKIEVECYRCGSSTFKFPCFIKRDDRHFCSDECRSSWLSDYMYCGGTVREFGDNYNEFREYVINRDEQVCQLCWIDRDEHYEKYERDIECHHIEPRKIFDDVNNADYDENGLTLCRRCNTSQQGLTKIVVHPDAGDISEITSEPPF